MKYVFVNMVSITCIVVSGLLIWNNKEEWEWFLIVAVILYTTIKEDPDPHKKSNKKTN